jgi:hypothetical protein
MLALLLLVPGSCQPPAALLQDGLSRPQHGSRMHLHWLLLLLLLLLVVVVVARGVQVGRVCSQRQGPQQGHC